MKPAKPLLILAVLIIAGSTLAQKKPEYEPIKTYKDKYMALILKKDIPGLIKLVKDFHTSDYVHYSKPGKDGTIKKSNMDDAIRGIRKVFATMDITHSGAKMDRMEVLPTTVTVLSSTGMSGTLKKETSPDKKPHEMILESQTQDVWVKVGKVWKMKTSKTLHDRITVDGHSQEG